MNPKINFYIKDKNAIVETAIYVRIGHTSKNYTSFKIYTKEKILPTNWDISKQRAKKGKDNFINQILNKIEKDLQDFFYEQRRFTDQKITKELIKSNIPYFNTGKVEDNKNDIEIYFKYFLDAHKSKHVLGTQKMFANLFKELKAYAKKSEVELDLNKIDLPFFEGFTNYLIIDRLQAKRTVNDKYTSKFITFLRWCNTSKYTNNADFLSFKKFKIPPADNIALTHDELKVFQNLELDSTLNYYRNLFLVLCYTGQRFQALKELTSQNIKLHTEKNINALVWHLYQNKTKKTVYIPIHKDIKEIVQKHIENIEPIYANSKFNKALKEIGELAGFTEIENKRLEDGTAIKLKRYERITNHTARRTFATIGIRLGIPERILKGITGHSSEKSFGIYIVEDLYETLIQMEKY